MATLQQRITDLAVAIRTKFNVHTAQIGVLTKLASDFNVAVTTFTDIPGFSFTPGANADFEIEARLILFTTTATNLPRIGVSIAAGQQWACAEIRQAGATDTAQIQTHGGVTTGAGNVQTAAGGLAAANSPRLCIVRVKGRAGATPGAVKVQMAAETAGANVCFVKAGSEMRSRTL